MTFINMKTFLTSFLQIGLVSVNTILLQKGIVPAIFVVAFSISFLWCWNVTKISISTTNDKIIYSLGAGCGSVFGYYLVNFVV